MLGVAYAATLADPALRDGPQGTTLVRAAALEFFAVHASGFLKWTWVTDWDVRRRALFVAELAAALSLGMGVASLVVGAWWPLVVFWALTGNRVLDAVVREAPKGRAMEDEALAWAGGVVLFVVAACGVGMGGLSRASVLAGGAFYFLANGVSELAGWRWAARWMAAGRARRGTRRAA